ncbi:DNA (cytosine-5)-methyltransferase 1 [Saccharothrix coeruleofusca]|uniref:DNA cytosine methyltransferase n=1 Tax=Saccharothrix coeruleofusca TaxID=33919 RepID=UPI0027DBF011|nr:DNA cytosine methyltransferase [Saccharothrix coeruleofusca]MBP2340493.1 DNA (cytosine-5)-methyltransferase 1 [Saccharothrix coeruleofusca]
MSKLAVVSEPTLPFEPTEPAAAEFFAGIGLARLGLQQAGFRVSWSNDIEPAKHKMYVENFRDDESDHTFVLGDVTNVKGADLPPDLSLAWASSPCVDVSLAGARLGLSGARSAAFYQFTRVLGELPEDKRPQVVTLENVVGLATSHGGADLAAAIRELNELGYSVDVLTLDARWFVPQSRPRLFVVGALHPPVDTPGANPLLRPAWLQAPFKDKTLRTHRYLLPDIAPSPDISLSQAVEQVAPDDTRWWDASRVAAFEAQLSPIQMGRLEVLRKGRRVTYRTAYRRTRQGKPQWEIRSDDIAGCLRTARGGSSKQAVVAVGKGELRIRWMTGLEYARLMGADDYVIEGQRDSHVIFGFGDAVCVPAVAWLAKHYLMPLVKGKVPIANVELAAVGA